MYVYTYVEYFHGMFRGLAKLHLKLMSLKSHRTFNETRLNINIYIQHTFFYTALRFV